MYFFLHITVSLQFLCLLHNKLFVSVADIMTNEIGKMNLAHKTLSSGEQNLLGKHNKFN